MKPPAIGHNSHLAEIDELRAALRADVNGKDMSPLCRARCEMIMSDLQSTDILVGLVMSVFFELRDGIADPGVKMMEVATKLADRRIRLGLKANEDRGFLAKQGGGHRGHTSAYVVQIPEKTITELLERRHGDAAFEKGGIGGTDGTGMPPIDQKGGKGGITEPPLPPLPPFKGGTGMPPFLAYKDTNNNYPCLEEEVEEAREPDGDDLVHVNGTGIEGPGFILKYRDIELYSEQTGVPIVKAKLYAELAARRWAAKGFAPDIPSAAFGRALAKNKIQIQTDAVQLQLAVERLRGEQATAAQPAQSARASPPPRPSVPDWRDERREAERRFSEAEKLVFGGE